MKGIATDLFFATIFFGTIFALAPAARLEDPIFMATALINASAMIIMMRLLQALRSDD